MLPRFTAVYWFLWTEYATRLPVARYNGEPVALGGGGTAGAHKGRPYGWIPAFEGMTVEEREGRRKTAPLVSRSSTLAPLVLHVLHQFGQRPSVFEALAEAGGADALDVFLRLPLSDRQQLAVALVEVLFAAA